jgi:hypothetical protein
VPTTVYQMAYFLPKQYEAAWERGLLNATNHRDHGDYRRENEQTMRGLAAQSTTPVRVMRLDVADLLAYAQREGKVPGEPADPVGLCRLVAQHRPHRRRVAAGTQRAVLVRLRRQI